MKTARWISLSQFKRHEFHRTLRHLKLGGKSWHEIYIRLGEIQAEYINAFLRSCLRILICYIVLNTLGKGDAVSVSFEGLTASVPVPYYTFIASLLFFVTMTQLQTVWMVITMRSREGVKMRLPGFYFGMYGLYYGQDSAALTTPIVLSNFFSERIGVAKIIVFLSTTVYVSCIIPLFAFSVYIFSWQIKILESGNTSTLGYVATCAGIFALATSFIFLLGFNIPLPVKKNKEGIRWGVLIRHHGVGSHPLLEKWLNESK